MTSVARKAFVYGRLRGLTAGRLARLAQSNGLHLVRRAASADLVVVAHSSAPYAVSDSGELRPPLSAPAAPLLSERSFLAMTGLAAPISDGEGPLSQEQVARLSGLSVAQVRTLSLYDALSPESSGYSHRDVVVARAAARLANAGAKLAKLIWAGSALEERGR